MNKQFFYIIYMIIFISLAGTALAYPQAAITVKDYYGNPNPGASLSILNPNSFSPLGVYTADSNGIVTVVMVPAEYILRITCTVPGSPVSTHVSKSITVAADTSVEISCQPGVDAVQKFFNVQQGVLSVASGSIVSASFIAGSLVAPFANNIKVLISSSDSYTFNLMQNINGNPVIYTQVLAAWPAPFPYIVKFPASSFTNSLQVTIKDQKGNPLANNWVSIYRGTSLFSTQRTDASGTISILADAGQYKVVFGGCVNPEGNPIAFSKEFTVPTGSLIIQCDFSSQAIITMADGLNNPIPQQTISVAGFSNYYKTTDATGEAVFNLPAGNYIFSTDYKGEVFKTSLTAISGPSTIVSMTVPSLTGSITATVIDSSGKALQGLAVTFKDEGTLTAAGFNADAYATTDIKGEATTLLYDGTYLVYVQCPSSTQIIQGIEVTGGNKLVSITCDDGIRIQTKIIFTNGSLVPNADLKIIPQGLEGVVGLERFGYDSVASSSNPGTFLLSNGNYKIKASVTKQGCSDSKYYNVNSPAHNDMLFEFVFDACVLPPSVNPTPIPQSTTVTAPDINLSFGALFAAVVLLSVLGMFAQQNNNTKR